MRKVTKIRIITYAALVGFMLILAALFYLTSYYEAASDVLELFDNLPQDITYKHGEYWHEFRNNGANASDRALVFYPGAKVDALAYLPTLLPVIEAGYPVFILEFPFHFAIFSPSRGANLIELYPDISHWTLSGHSLGGVIAGWQVHDYYQDESESAVDSLILLASYVDGSHNLSESEAAVLSIFADNDGLLTEEEVEENAANLPADTIFRSIIGANHAQFASYGLQSGDNTASISASAQQERTAQLMLQFLGGL